AAPFGTVVPLASPPEGAPLATAAADLAAQPGRRRADRRRPGPHPPRPGGRTLGPPARRALALSARPVERPPSPPRRLHDPRRDRQRAGTGHADRCPPPHEIRRPPAPHSTLHPPPP